MVKAFIFFLLLLSPLLSAKEFSASVSKNQVGIGESFILALTLKDAVPKGAPLVDSLKKDFVIHSQQQSSNTTIINGKVSSSVSWKISLSSLKEGNYTIPSLTINTPEGQLQSSSIAIRVVQGKTGSDTGLGEEALTYSISKTDPYKNEPFFFTIKLASKVDLVNVTPEKFYLEDAVVEISGEPKIYQQTIDGINFGILEYSYLITPLKAGPLKIPAIVITGAMQVKKKARFGSFFDDEFESSFFWPDTDRLKPFALSTKEYTLEVQPAPMEMNPWLPATAFKVEEIFDSNQKFQVGEPITRSFIIAAEGVGSSQLPSLDLEKNSDNTFKVYADKPEVGEEIKEGKILSYRKENYTLIAQKAGKVTLPEISVSWWDVIKKEKIVSKIPKKTITILPEANIANTATQSFKSEINEQLESKDSFHQKEAEKPFEWVSFYTVSTAVLISLLMAAFIWAMALRKRIGQLSSKNILVNNPLPKKMSKISTFFSKKKSSKKKNSKKEKLPDLNPT